MSFRYLNAAWELELPSHLKIVLLSLADQANDDGECWPSQSTIGRRCGTSSRQVSTNLRTLREMGLIEMVKRRRRKTAVYHLLIAEAPDAETPDRKSTSDQGVANDDTPKRQDRKPTAVKTGSAASQDRKRTSHKPLKEPSDEPSVSLATDVAHEIEVIEVDGQTYEMEITDRSPHDQMTYIIVDAMGWEPSEVTEPQWGAIHKAAKELLRRDAKPEHVAHRAQVYRLKHPDWALTPSALVKWWADSAQVDVRPSRGQVADLSAAAERRNWRASR